MTKAQRLLKIRNRHRELVRAERRELDAVASGIGGGRRDELYTSRKPPRLSQTVNDTRDLVEVIRDCDVRQPK